LGVVIIVQACRSLVPPMVKIAKIVRHVSSSIVPPMAKIVHHVSSSIAPLMAKIVHHVSSSIVPPTSLKIIKMAKIVRHVASSLVPPMAKIVHHVASFTAGLTSQDMRHSLGMHPDMALLCFVAKRNKMENTKDSGTVKEKSMVVVYLPGQLV